VRIAPTIGAPIPSRMKARGVSMRSVIQAKFIPKNPVTKVSGRKMVAKTASLPRIWVWAWSVSQVSLQVL
jgi:hypothetical protein